MIGTTNVPTLTPARRAIYRFFNTNTEAHFFTINADERASIIGSLPQFRYEAEAYYAMQGSSQGYQPVYRFYNTQTLAHFFTINEEEKNTVIASYPFYRFEGIAWYATTDSNLALNTGALPVYRFFNFKTSTHFYTINESERLEVQEKYPTQFRFEGVAYYAWTETQRPVASIAPPAVALLGRPASLDGSSSSDPDGDTLSYEWRLVSAPAGSGATLTSLNGALVAIQADVAGSYSVQLVVRDGSKASEPVTQTVQVAQALSGTITGVRTLENLGYPYVLTGRLTVGNGASLILAPGVTLDGKGQMIQVAGSVTAQGRANARIKMSNVVLATASVNSAPYAIDIRFADIEGGSLNTVFNDNGTGNITLMDSTIRNTADEIYLTQAQSTHRVERNVFSNAGGLYFSTSGPQKIVIRNNVFQRWSTEAAITHGQNLTIFGSPSYDISRNSFIGLPGQVAMRLTNISNAGFDAPNNYWGTVNALEIDAMIIDQQDDLNYRGFITYAPILPTPDALTPLP